MVGSTRLFSVGILVLIVSGVGIACQGSDLTLPSDGGTVFNLHIVSGDGQRGTVGAELDSALVVAVTNGAGEPVTDISLRFEPKTPGAQVERELVTTNQEGEAETRVRLGDTEGTQTVEVRLAEVEAAPKIFSLTAVAQPPEEEKEKDKGRGRGRGRGNGGGNGGDADDDEEEDDDD